MKQRTKLLKDNVDDINWLGALEKKLSDYPFNLFFKIRPIRKISKKLILTEKFPKLEMSFMIRTENDLIKKAII